MGFCEVERKKEREGGRRSGRIKLEGMEDW